MQAITGSQWRSVSSGVVCVYLGIMNMRPAAAFWMSCSGLMAEAGRPDKKGVAVVQAGQDHCLDEELGWVGCEEWTDSPDLVQEEPACPGHRCDVLGEGQPVVHHHRFLALRLRWVPLVKWKNQKRERLELGRRLAPSYLGWASDGGCPSSSGCPSGRQRSVTDVSINPVVTQSFKIWLQFRKHFSLQRSSTHAPVSQNPNFKPSIMDSAFQLWSDRGIISINYLYDNCTFMSFTDLSAKFQLPSSHLFCFFQIRHFVQKNCLDFPNHPPQTLLDTLLILKPNQSGNISHICITLDSIISDFPQQTRKLWKQDLGHIEDDQWDNILELVHNSSICARHGLIQCKLIHRTYYTNHRLSKIYPNVVDACNRCNQCPADLIHMFWSCPKLADFWSTIFNTLHMVSYSFVADPHPLSALIWYPFTWQHSVSWSTTLARRLILRNWKQALPPSYDRCIREVLYNLKLERLRFSLRGSFRKFDKIWNPLLSIIDSLDIIPDESDIWALLIYSVTTHQSTVQKYIYIYIYCWSCLFTLFCLVFLSFHIMFCVFSTSVLCLSPRDRWCRGWGSQEGDRECALTFFKNVSTVSCFFICLHSVDTLYCWCSIKHIFKKMLKRTCWFCRFAHLQRMELYNFNSRYILTLRDRISQKNPE